MPKNAPIDSEADEPPPPPQNPVGDFSPVDPPIVAKMRARMPEIEAEYFQRYRLAAERQATEVAAVTVLQSRWRGFIVRSGIRKLSATALFCQRVWRGYLGRQRFREHLEVHQAELRQAYFRHMATEIQRVWRGYLSRKHVHSFYARKAYLEMVAAKNAETRLMLEQEYQRAMVERETVAQEAAHARFGNTIQKMHHLVSTAAQPGIFNSPYSHVTGGPPAVAGVPVEAHLQDTVRGLLQKKSVPRNGSGLLPAITDRPPLSNYTHTGRLKALASAATHASPNLSLQASVPAVLAHHDQDFSTTIREPVPQRHKHFQLPALKCDDPYYKDNEPLLRRAPDSLDPETLGLHPHVTKPFKTAIPKQTYFQDSLNLEREYYNARAAAAQLSAQSSPQEEGPYHSLQRMRLEQMADV
eukprot:CAMPEP_0177784202 /NCGR_PEP_ID=MMETSP0491_2-20121128/19554_1 /TAXON_ID=63592 /ORGANISM="Tetraselmis chuii, Strain PLY429" /LENGTH=412 /DNA_ID=CAMNT_0019304911 /DNA_START=162 /DNA_END=1400 /DNA_ORIENTATION=+